VRVIVVGFGSFGSWFARSMLEMDHEVIVVERDEALVDRLADWATKSVVGDATDPAVLERAGGADADAGVIATGDDLATTILATLALRDLGVEHIYAKVRSTSEARALEALQVTEAIFPEREAGYRLAHRITSRKVKEYTPIAPGCSIQEISVPDGWVGQTILDISPREHGVTIVAVRDTLNEDDVEVPPDPRRELRGTDTLLVAGRDEAIEPLAPEEA